MKRFFVIVFLFAFVQTAFSQLAATVKGELLVQLKQNATPSDVEKEALEELGILPALKMKEVVSDYMRIWLFTFNEDEIAKRDMIRMMNTLKSVSVAQANHIVADRVVPNDPFFGQQWHHFQANDKDIDSDEAWNITTGGLTATGDSIVVCVVETGGAKWDIPDLIQNHWVNILEIPDNEIDDDANGYIDDYHGWSISTDDDDVFGNGSHGAQVSSMIGSKGNNGIGVTGVNWNVKLMQVRMGGINESNVIAAYTYPLVMRKRYNQTSGAEGAFVVAVNSSWGTDFGQPADAPLWCALYDSLGTYGVLSCAATANNNTNVDTMGDLPTACPSDYLISVTNTNSSDVKVNSAGYGVVTIDLGAPGNQIYLANNNAYGNASGTSFSSPCVAGTVALLYSAPCSTLMSIVEQGPGVAALQIKNYILAGVDQTTELQTQTLSGGRLNINNSLVSLLEICGTCVTPVAPFAQQLEGSLDYTINWVSVADVNYTVLRYRILGNPEWTTVDNLTSSPYLLEDLLACSQYEFQMKSFCDEESSDWSDVVVFDTDGCCMHPNNVVISSVEENSAYVVWTPVLAASDYTVVVIDDSGTNTTINSIPDAVLYLDFLESCVYYSVYVYSNCIGELPPPFQTTFITAGCGACTDSIYCIASGGDNTEYIRRVKVGEIDYVSTQGLGYNFIHEQTTIFELGQTYAIECYPEFTNPNSPLFENFRVWIDYNADGEFQHPEEMAFDADAPTQTMASGFITIPLTATEGYVRMRVAMRYSELGSTEPQACAIWSYGEVEDYCVTLQEHVISIEEIGGQSQFSIYPNPLENQLYIKYDDPWLANSQLLIFDMTGSLVDKILIRDNSPVDVGHLVSGVYSVVVISDMGSSTVRFVKL